MKSGHHVQTVLGISDKVRAAQQQASEAEANALQVRMELQADCYAGIWAHHADRARQLVEAGDIDEALTAASAVGDDTIQRRVQGHVNQESFTHGSGAQRQEWFRRGYRVGPRRRTATRSNERTRGRSRARRDRRLPVRRRALRVLRAARERARLPLPHVPARHRRRVRGARRRLARQLRVDARHAGFFASSNLAQRGFCAKCGTPLSFKYDTPSARMYTTIGSLDRARERGAS